MYAEVMKTSQVQENTFYYRMLITSLTVTEYLITRCAIFLFVYMANVERQLALCGEHRTSSFRVALSSFPTEHG